MYCLWTAKRVSAGMALHAGPAPTVSKSSPELAEHWSHSTDVGLGGEEPLNVDGLQILIEKDFDCVSPRAGEEDIDTFPNPSLTNC